ncbi:FUSC family protein [Streptomyces sp. XM83C]|uniref:FUSC family protein n=1 Tax=unclassified Streptomyces TaxID=2593676 RepID=UPI001FF879E4|nr:FUSC family protein [Streptomyces sp. XM83C]MCK1823628.1 FUSC family protein [Streptomyces sp. XM83C]
MSRLRGALAGNVDAPAVWLTASFALVGLVIAAGVAASVGLADVALPAGFVAAIAGVAGGLVPPGLTRQVTVPACVAVALAPALASAGEGRPVVAGLLSAVVIAVAALAQQDVPTGMLVGALGSTTYVLAVGLGLVRDVPLSHTLIAGGIGLVSAVVTTVAARAVKQWQVRRGGGAAVGPGIPPLPGWFVSRLLSGIGAALRDWRHNPYARLALRRVVVLAPLVGVLEARRDPVALYALVVAFSITQPTTSDTLDRALARTAGVIGAIGVTVVIGALAPDWVLVVFAVVAMVGGLAHVLRSPFLTSLGTTVLTIATGYLAGSSIPAVNRLISTVVGALIGLLATVIIPAPKPQEQSGSSAAADRGTDTE